MKKRLLLTIIFMIRTIFVIPIIFNVKIYAGDAMYFADDNSSNDYSLEQDIVEYDDFDTTELNELIKKETNNYYSFDSVIAEIINSDTNFFQTVIHIISSSIGVGFDTIKIDLKKVIILTFCLAIITNAMNAFGKMSTSDVGFFVVYIILFEILIHVYDSICYIATSILDIIIRFIECLIPSFFLAIGVSNGYNSSVGLLSITLATISIFEHLIKNILIPLTSIYLSISLIDNITKERKFKRISDMLEHFIVWILRMLMIVVCGLNLIESMVMPAADFLSKKGVGHVISMIPGVGNSISGATRLIVSSGEVIKNTIGGGALACICLITIIPLSKIKIIQGAYKVIAGITEPISESRVTSSIDSLSRALGLLFKICMSSIIMICASIAIICLFVKGNV